MRKILLLILPLLLAILVFLGITFFTTRASGKGALQVTANPKSNVYLNGKLIGQTPLCKCDVQNMVTAGDYTIRVVPTGAGLTAFQEKISIQPSVLTVVDRSFGQGGASDGSIITLTPLDNKKSVELLIISFPENVEVSIDNAPVGKTPLLTRNLTESDHEIKLSKSGYRDKVIRIRTVAGYKLTTTVYLGVSQILETPPPASSSAQLQATPSASVTTKNVTVLSTPTGFLRVRSDATLDAGEVGRVSPGDVLPVLDEKSGWYKVKLPTGISGWITSQYAKVQ